MRTSPSLNILSKFTLAVAMAAVSLSGCKSSQDKALEQAKKQAAATGQAQQIVTTDKNGNTVTTTVQPPLPGQTAEAVTTTVTPKPAAGPATGALPAGSGTQQPAPAPQVAATQPDAQPAPQPVGPPPPPATINVAKGTTLVIRIDQRIAARESHPGDRFTGQVVEPVTGNGATVIPKGALVRGKVVSAKGPGHFKGAADIELRLTSLTLDGKAYDLDTRDVLRTKKGKGKRSAAFIGGGSGLGLLIGGLAGGGKGALIGGLAGAGAGTAGAGLTGNRDLVIPAESIVRFKLADDLEIDQ
jgi:hypothetical protein